MTSSPDCDTGWYYADFHGVRQGPFSNSEMHDWFADLQFPELQVFNSATSAQGLPLSVLARARGKDWAMIGPPLVAEAVAWGTVRLITGASPDKPAILPPIRRSVRARLALAKQARENGDREQARDLLRGVQLLRAACKESVPQASL